MTRLVIAGVSTRAAAESAAAAGFDVTAIDAFGDIDQHPSVHVQSLARGFTPRAAARAARTRTCDAVVYLSNFENHPRAIDALAEGRALWGNASDNVRRVRNPLLLADTLRRQGFAVPEVRLQSDFSSAAGSLSPTWLVKPVASGGGQRIREWRRQEPLPRGCYLQQFIDGVPGSIAFVANRGRAVPIALSRQLIGDPAFGASGYQYCGSILGPRGDAQFAQDDSLVDAAASLARVIASEFDLIGVNGIDFIARDGVPYTVEVNPRWSSSMELAERAYRVSILGVHAAACGNGTLPNFDLAAARHGAAAIGKAVVFARQDVTVRNTSNWRTAADDVRDIPHAGDQILAGAPVCTVFASGRDAAACYDALVACAARMYAQLGG